MVESPVKKLKINKEVKFSVLSIFEEKFLIGCHLEFVSRLFSRKIEPKSQVTKTTLSQKAYF
jgi:hypothetical protein